MSRDIDALNDEMKTARVRISVGTLRQARANPSGIKGGETCFSFAI
jgi:hypothetical protein